MVFGSWAAPSIFRFTSNHPSSTSIKSILDKIQSMSTEWKLSSSLQAIVLSSFGGESLSASFQLNARMQFLTWMSFRMTPFPIRQLNLQTSQAMWPMFTASCGFMQSLSIATDGTKQNSPPMTISELVLLTMSAPKVTASYKSPCFYSTIFVCFLFLFLSVNHCFFELFRI